MDDEGQKSYGHEFFQQKFNYIINEVYALIAQDINGKTIMHRYVFKQKLSYCLSIISYCGFASTHFVK